MNLNISLSAIKQPLVTFLHRFHLMIFVIVVLNGLTVVIFLLNSSIIKSSDSSGYTPNTDNATFDQATIKRIEELKTRDQAGNDLDLSGGRTNPFVE
jgi:hypothetical protein